MNSRELFIKHLVATHVKDLIQFLRGQNFQVRLEAVEILQLLHHPRDVPRLPVAAVLEDLAEAREHRPESDVGRLILPEVPLQAVTLELVVSVPRHVATIVVAENANITVLAPTERSSRQVSWRAAHAEAYGTKLNITEAQ